VRCRTTLREKKNRVSLSLSLSLSFCIFFSFVREWDLALSEFLGLSVFLYTTLCTPPFVSEYFLRRLRQGM